MKNADFEVKNVRVYEQLIKYKLSLYHALDTTDQTTLSQLNMYNIYAWLIATKLLNGDIYVRILYYGYSYAYNTWN